MTVRAKNSGHLEPTSLNAKEPCGVRPSALKLLFDLPQFCSWRLNPRSCTLVWTLSALNLKPVLAAPGEMGKGNGILSPPARLDLGYVVPDGLAGKESARNAGDMASIPGLGRSHGEGNGNPLQHSCLKNPLDRGCW